VTSAAAPLQGLVVDWGGVLTAGLDGALAGWADGDGIDLAVYQGVIRDWLGPEVGRTAWLNPIHALERGEMAVPDFERRLAAELSERAGRHLEPEGLLQRMFDQFEHAPTCPALVRRARGAGLRTALLSNSWGNEYPREGWSDMFDSVVISGEVGMRKPERRIYEHTVSALGLAAHECVFVDDLRINVTAAAEVGMVGVHHTSYDDTAAELEALFGIALRS
jgi:putative hydrolase of the HAD superfamily